MHWLKTLPVTVIAARASDSDEDPAPEMFDLASASAADSSTQAEVPAAPDAPGLHSSAAGPLPELFAVADVPLVQLQQEHKFAFATYCHKAHQSLDGGLSLVYYCNRGPKEEQTFIWQYILLGDLAHDDFGCFNRLLICRRCWLKPRPYSG